VIPNPAQNSAPHPSLPVLRLKRGEERRLVSGHAWVFSNEVDIASTPLTAFSPGALAQLQAHNERFLGYAYVNPHALICARIVARRPDQAVDQELIEQRLRVALALRERMTRQPYYRLIFGESDGLPGLILDRYGSVMVGQIATAGMEALRSSVEAAVGAVMHPACLFWKNDSGARELEHLPQQAHAAFGEAPQQVEVIESGVKFSAPLAH